jgi:hypothetical protein
VIKLEKKYEVEEPTRPTTLQDLMSRSETKPNPRMDMDTDTKPDISNTVNGDPGVGIKPIYGFEGVPSLPPKWTYATPEIVCLRNDSLADDRMR